jgi:hypothetical protein
MPLPSKAMKATLIMHRQVQQAIVVSPVCLDSQHFDISLISLLANSRMECLISNEIPFDSKVSGCRMAPDAFSLSCSLSVIGTTEEGRPSRGVEAL